MASPTLIVLAQAPCLCITGLEATGPGVESAWVAALLGFVAFGCTLVLLLQAVGASQERTGRPTRLMRIGAVPGAVPVVAAAVVGVAVAGLAWASTLGAVVVTGLVVAALLMAIGWRLSRS